MNESCPLKLPVPPGFTISTRVCTYFYEHKHKYPKGLDGGVSKSIAKIEKALGRTFGGNRNPLLVSVRSGARVSMPGMMDTVLNLGLTDETVEGLAKDEPHPVQAAMVEHHGSQCGFCTPGIVMSLYARAVAAKGADAPVDEVLAGNLCRCTGYGPIIAAAEAVVPEAAPDVADRLVALRREQALSLAAEIAEGAPLAVRSTRATLRRGLADAVRAQTARELAEQTRLARTEDHQEGIRAVTERRPGQFQER